jgi:hypothetical protein
MLTDRQKEAVRQLSCPTCYVLRGEHCTSKSGSWSRPHVARVQRLGLEDSTRAVYMTVAEWRKVLEVVPLREDTIRAAIRRGMKP